MFNKITIADARKQFSDIINRVAYNDESFVLTKRGEPIAALVSMKELKLLQEIKEQIDIKDANKDKNEINEPDEPIPWGDLIKDLGF
ncbi:MAG: type II toxin-antitoxin system Phd/YefM family antitoxin [Pseudomonadota bacterium]